MNLISKSKRFVVFAIFLVTSLMVNGKLSPEISQVIAKQFSYAYDSNLMSSEDPIFVNYIHKDWREIADNIEWLPLAEGDRIPEKQAFNLSVMYFGQTCESLPPLEYLDFFEKMLSLAEEDRISFSAIEFLYYAQDEKDCFFSVNWEYPRVQKILNRFIKLIPPEEASLLNMVKVQSKGELAENYLNEKSDDARLPETLPGIKLKRPWDSLIKQYEKLTGKNVEVPYHPHYNPRPTKEMASRPQIASTSDKIASVFLSPLFWMISGGLVAIVGVVFRVSHNSKRMRKA